ncbi:MAG: MlaD family protein [Syntrophobacteraceae bacterium]
MKTGKSAEGELLVSFKTPLTYENAAEIWQSLSGLVARKENASFFFDFSRVSKVDSAGVAIWLKSAFWFQDTKIYAAFFNFSVKGLHKDAVVNFRGVPVGRIDDVRIAPDGRLIEVLAKLKADFRVDKGVKDLTATLASTRKFSDQLSQQLDSLPPGTLKRLSDQFGETLQSGGTAFSNLGTKINESADLLERDLQQLGVLIAQLNSLVHGVKEQPNRLISPGKQPQEPFKSK